MAAKRARRGRAQGSEVSALGAPPFLRRPVSWAADTGRLSSWASILPSAIARLPAVLRPQNPSRHSFRAMSLPWKAGSTARHAARVLRARPAARLTAASQQRACLATIAADQQPAHNAAAEASGTTGQPGNGHSSLNTKLQQRPLTPEQQKFLDAAVSCPVTPPKKVPTDLPLKHHSISNQSRSPQLRVNHAGELAAVLIYSSQTPPLLRQHPHLKSLMDHMYEQEAGHFATFSELLAKHRIRPTAMYPVWTVAAKVLGWGTGVMGREAAMACTEAVETEIGDHYNSQIRVLLEWAEQEKREGRSLGEEFEVLLQDLRRIRDEELEHLDHAVEHDAKEAKPYELLTGVIRAGCRGAIWITEKV